MESWKSIESQQRSQRIQKELENAQSNAAQACIHGQRTITTLQQQDEQLGQVSDTLEANEHSLNQSMTVLRGMTWSGYFYNKLTNAKEYITNNTTSSTTITSKSNNSEGDSKKVNYQNVLPSTITPGLIKSNEHTSSSSSKYKNQYSNDAYYDRELGQVITLKEKNELLSSCHNSSTTATATAAAATEASSMEEERKGLEQIEASVKVLHQMSITIGEQIHQQNHCLEYIEDQTERCDEKTLAVTLKTSQLTNRTRKKPPLCIGTYYFIDEDTDQYLAVSSNHQLYLTAYPNRSISFQLYVKESNIFGLFNEKIQKFVGCTITGQILVSGEYFGKYEECYVDLSESTTKKGGFRYGICFLARNWGSGGWLRYPFIKEDEVNNSSSSMMTSSIREVWKGVTSAAATTAATATTAASFKDDEVIHNNQFIPLIETTGSIHDKTCFVRLKAIKQQIEQNNIN